MTLPHGHAPLPSLGALGHVPSCLPTGTRGGLPETARGGATEPAHGVARPSRPVSHWVTLLPTCHSCTLQGTATVGVDETFVWPSPAWSPSRARIPGLPLLRRTPLRARRVTGETEEQSRASGFHAVPALALCPWCIRGQGGPCFVQGWNEIQAGDGGATLGWGGGCGQAAPRGPRVTGNGRGTATLLTESEPMNEASRVRVRNSFSDRSAESPAVMTTNP